MLDAGVFNGGDGSLRLKEISHGCIGCAERAGEATNVLKVLRIAAFDETEETRLNLETFFGDIRGSGDDVEGLEFHREE